MPKRLTPARELTDEQVLQEFVKRFQCDGAILIYLDEGIENWFGRWRNKTGRVWVRDFVAHMQRHLKDMVDTSEKNESLAITYK